MHQYELTDPVDMLVEKLQKYHETHSLDNKFCLSFLNQARNNSIIHLTIVHVESTMIALCTFAQCTL